MFRRDREDVGHGTWGAQQGQVSESRYAYFGGGSTQGKIQGRLMLPGRGGAQMEWLVCCLFFESLFPTSIVCHPLCPWRLTYGLFHSSCLALLSKVERERSGSFFLHSPLAYMLQFWQKIHPSTVIRGTLAPALMELWKHGFLSLSRDLRVV